MAKVMVSLPDELLELIDAEASRRATSRSALLADSARRELARPRTEDLVEAMARSEYRFSTAGDFEAADLIRADRDGGR